MALSSITAATAVLAHVSWLAAGLGPPPLFVPLPGPAVFGAGILAGVAVVATARIWVRVSTWAVGPRIPAGPRPATDEPAPTEVPATPRCEQQVAATLRAAPAPALRIGLLGALTVNDQPGALVPAQSQLIVALALSRACGLPNRELCRLLGPDPDHPRPTDSLRQLIVRTRRQLGLAGDGRQWIEHRGHGVYALHPAATVDWAEFDQLTADGIRTGDGNALGQALAKVRGQPFTGCDYWWLDMAQVRSATNRIVRAAVTLSEIELGHGRPAEAARAARTGLIADASAEQLWRLLMRAEHAAGNLAGVRETWDRCQAAIAELAADGQPESVTTAIYAKLLADRVPRKADSHAL